MSVRLYFPLCRNDVSTVRAGNLESPFAVVVLKALLKILMIRVNFLTVANVTHWRYTESSARVPVTRPSDVLHVGKMTGVLRVRTCENCGADTVDSRGICQNCGWSESDQSSSSPSLGETRAAQIAVAPTDSRGMATSPRIPSNVAPQYPFERTVDMPRSTPPVSPLSRTGASGPNAGGTQGGSSRYCGTCGARIEPGEVFCGQCGTPVGAGGNNPGAYGGGRSSASGRYRTEDEGVWSPGQGDALTEAIMSGPPTPMPAQFGRGAVSSPYSATYAPTSGYDNAGSARTTRIVWGILCLVASLLLAAAAVGVYVIWQ
jgi:zinc-ribbon domain